MKATFTLLACLFLSSSLFATNAVLIVADEIPAMELLAHKLEAGEHITSQVVRQTNLPPTLSPLSAVIVYIHKELNEAAEKAFIDYTRGGGKLIVLHHSISSTKRKNKYWFDFLGVSLPEGDVSQGGYKWIEGITQRIVNLAPDHFITTNKVSYPESIAFKPAGHDEEKLLPGFTLEQSEVYLNHVLTGPRTLLLGLKYTDTQTGKVYMQSHAGWLKPSGKGWIIYLQPGHSVRDLDNPAYGRILLNAVIWQP